MKALLLLGVVFVVLAGLILADSTAEAGYEPSPVLIAQLHELARRSEPSVLYTPFGEFVTLEVVVGKTYQPGMVAYFSVLLEPKSGVVLEAKMQLEEWTLLEFLEEVVYLVTFSKFEPKGMLRWTLVLTGDGHLLIETLGPNFWFDANSPESIEASEKAQELLMRAGERI